MEKIQLVFIPNPTVGHLIPAVMAAKLLLERHNNLTISVLIIKKPRFDSKINDFTHSFAASTALSNPIKFIDLPEDEEPENYSFYSFVHSQKSHVKEAVSKIIRSDESTFDSPRLAGFVLDMFCTTFIDVANEFGVPSYIFFTSSAAFLGFMLHLQMIYDEKKNIPTELNDSSGEFVLPCLVNSFPLKVMPSGDWFYPLVDNIRRFKETKGILVNTFLELESYAVKSFFDDKLSVRPLYPVGPNLNVGLDEINNEWLEIKEWLDDQPLASVVFLCFGSLGSFAVDQVKEIACALEHSGHRFLWSLRRPPPPGKDKSQCDYEDFLEVLPNGFLDRMTGIGKIIRWAPQKAILAHPAIGGFVSHCGWNSILESIWYGIPIAAWPMYGEQQFNAFEMVIELGLAVEIKMDYKRGNKLILNSDEIERGIRSLMMHDNEERKKMKKTSEKSRKALMDGGSSCIWLDHFIKDVIDNMI